MLFLGIDCGTHGVRASCFDDNGTSLARASERLSTHFPSAVIAEQNPVDWWVGLKKTVARVLTTVAHRREPIKAIGICGTSSTLVPCSPNDLDPIGLAILWMDNRAQAEANELRAAGFDVSSEHMAPKALWLANNVKKKFVIVEGVSWLVHKLTGVMTLSNSISDFTWGVPPDRWSLFEALGEAQHQRLPPEYATPLRPQHNAGQLLREVGKELSPENLLAESIVCVGGNDALVSVLGAGLLLDRDVVFEIGGTSYVQITTQNNDPKSAGAWSKPQSDPFVSMNDISFSSIETAGLVLDKVSELLQFSKSEFDELLRIPQAKPSLLSISLGILGRKTTFGESDVTVKGLDMNTSRADLVDAVLQRVASIAHERVEQLNLTSRRVLVTGGLSEGLRYLQIRSQVSDGMQLLHPSNSGTGELGAAICAACAVNKFTDICHASKEMVPEMEVYEC